MGSDNPYDATFYIIPPTYSGITIDTSINIDADTYTLTEIARIFSEALELDVSYVDTPRNKLIFNNITS